MDDIDIEIDVDDSNASVEGHFQSNSESQQTFNALVHGLEKFEDLDAFLTQGDVRNVLEFGYDPFQTDRSMPDDPHILESTLDSILGVNEEEEVVGQGIIINEDLGHGFHKSESQGNVEIEIKDSKKYNTRQRRRPNNDSMFIYESPATTKTSSASKMDKPKRKHDQNTTRGRPKNKVKVPSDECESGDDEDENQSKDKDEQTDQKQSFDDRRLTRRQSQLTGIKPSSILKANQKDSRMEVEDTSSKIGSSEEDNETNSDVTSTASQEKSLQNAKRTNKLRSGKKLKSTKKQEENDSLESNDDYDDEEEDDDIDGHFVDGEDNDSLMTDVLPVRSSSDKDEGEKQSKQLQRKDDNDDSEDGTSDGDFKCASDRKRKEIVDEKKSTMMSKAPQQALWEKVSIDTSPNSDNEPIRIKSNATKSDKPFLSENAMKERKTVGNTERKLKDSVPRKKEVDKDQDSKDGGTGQKVKTISLEMFVQSSMRKGGKICRGPGCETSLNLSQKSIYCGQNCIEKYSQYVLQVQARERSRMGQPSGSQINDRLVMMEKQTGKILTGPAAPTESTLCTWLTRHPSFEVMLSSQSLLDEKKEKKITAEKRMLPPSLRDNPALTKEIKSMAAKLLGQKKEVDDVNKTCGSGSPFIISSGTNNTVNQLKRPDPTRISVRNVLREALTGRANGSDDVMVSANEIKSLAMDIEDELCKLCEGVTAKYKYKVKAIVTQIKDMSNKGFFRRLLFGELQPNQLVRLTNEKIASKELAVWNEDSSGLGILGSDAAFQTSYEDKPRSPPCQPIFDIVSSATSETTSQHGTHFFDMNCKICTGKVPEPAYNPSSKSEAHFGYYSKSITQTSPISSYPLSPSNSKPPLKMPLLPTPSIPSQEFFSSSNPGEQTLQSKATGGSDVDDGLWTGTIYAKEITSVRINTYLISGSVSSPNTGSVRSILQEDLSETIHMTGRMAPESVFSFVTHLKGSGRLSKEVAVVYFLPASTSEDSFYQSLYSYLVARNRCGVISSRAKKEVGRIKELYILPLPANTPPPSVLLPFEGPGLPTTRGDLILGIITKHSAQKSSQPMTAVSKSSTNSLKLPPNSSAAQSQANIKVHESPSSGAVKDDDDDNESDVDNKVIFNSAKSDHAKDSSAVKIKVKRSEETPSLVEDEPYEPFECPDPSKTSAVVAAPTTHANVPLSTQTSIKTNIETTSSSSLKAVPSRVNVVTPTNMNLSILASENIAATMLTTLSAVTNSTSLKEQQRMLQELTQKINEQKVILQQQEQSIKTTSDSPPSISSTAANVITGSPHSSSSSSIAMPEVNLTPASAILKIQTLKSSADIIISSSAKLISSGNATSTYAPSHSRAVISMAGDNVQKTVAPVISTTDRSQVSPVAVPNVSGNILASLPASINQLLSGEAFKNLKNIMANMSTGKQQSQIQTTQSSSKGVVENLSCPSKDDPEGSRECNTNVHGDVDYRLEPKKSQSSTDKQVFAQLLHLETGNINKDQFNVMLSQKPANVVIKKPLLATPPQSPLLVSQSRSSDNIPNAQNSYNEVFDHKKSSNHHNKNETTVWKPLLPRSESSSHSSSRDRPRRGGSGTSLKRRDNRKDKSRSRERKRKRSPDQDTTQENKKRNDKSHCSSGAGESTSEVKDGDDSDDVQIIREEKAAAHVIEIDAEEGEPSGHGEESRSMKSESKEGSSERSSKKMERTRERSSSRSRHGRRRKRSRSPNNNQQIKTMRRSRSRSPMKRQTLSKINPLNLPHNLPSLFPSLMQIVGGSNLSKKSEPSESAPKSSIPSLLDMLDPSILPEKYKKTDNSGLLGSYKDSDNFKATFENVDVKSFKKGLLGDFPSQLSSESKTANDVEDSVNRNLAMLRMESNKLDETSSQTLSERELNRPPNSNMYENTEGWMPANSHNPNQAFDNGVRGPNKPSDEERMNPKDRTLLPTPKIEEPCNNYSPYPPSYPESWNYPRNDMYPQDNPSFPSNSFYHPGKMRPQMSPPPLMMPRPRNDRPFLRFPQDSMVGPTNTAQGYFNDGQRFHRPRFGPTRFPKRQPYTSK